MVEDEGNGREYWRLRTEALQNDYQMRELLREEFRKALDDHIAKCPAVQRNATVDRVVTGIVSGTITGSLVAIIVAELLSKGG